MPKLKLYSATLLAALFLMSCNDTSSSKEEASFKDTLLSETKVREFPDFTNVDDLLRGMETPRIKPPPIQLLGHTQANIREREARSYVERAAKIGNPFGPDDHYILAKAHESQSNMAEALKHFELSALYGGNSAQLKLAKWYDEDGGGGEVNYRKAYLYYYLHYTQRAPTNKNPIYRHPEFEDAITRLIPRLSQADLDWVSLEEKRHLTELRNWFAVVLEQRAADRKNRKALESLSNKGK